MEINKIYCGDNLEIMREMESESVDLVYLDPPFFTQRDWNEFDDRFDNIDHYVEWMVERLTEMYRILKSTGSIYLHIDYHAVHYLKVEMDKIYGINNFQNEIIWHYKGRGMQKHRYQRKHDTLLFYSKSKNFTFNSNNILVPYDPKHVCRYNNIDCDGKRYANIKNKNGKYSKIYLKSGLIPDDVWEMPFIHGTEYLDYPTQKPEVLLERIIKASSNKNDIILDPFCGSGTSIAVAKKFGRKYIGIDISPIAHELSEKRISKGLDRWLGAL